MNSSRDELHNTVPVIDNVVLHTSKSERLDIMLSALTTATTEAQRDFRM